MAKLTLTSTSCRDAKCPPGKRKIDLWDTAISGFVLEIRASGGKTYYLRYFDEAGRQRQHKIASYNDVSFDKARKAAQRLRSEVVMGGDPATKKKEKRAVGTYFSLAEEHIAYAKTYQKRPENTEAIINRHLIPRWGKLRLDEITQQDVAKWLGEKRASGLAPATVEKLRVILSRGFELAARWKLPGAQHNPVRGIPRPRYSNARERYLTAEESDRLLKATESSVNTQLKPIVSLLLLTGARVSELLHAEWRHVDKTRRSWFVPDSKSGKSRHIPLSTPALGVIEELRTWDRCPYLVPNPVTQKPFVSIKHAWQTARKEAGLPDLRIHDLRHAAASSMVSAGVSLYTVGKILGHSHPASSQRYSHLADESLLAAVEAGAARLKTSATSPG